MKKVYLLAFLLFSTFSYSTSTAQCVLSASDDTQAEVIACLSSCGCSTIIIPNPVSIALANDWDLTGQGAITITIENGGQLALNGNGANNRDLKLGNGSILFVENTDPNSGTQGIVSSSGGGQIKITIGGTEYDKNSFDDIIEAGGADETPGDGVLPVDLISFSASIVGEAVKLSWATASESNNDYFTLEKSRNGRDFERLATVNGNGTVSIPSHYEFMDFDPFLGLSYYRLSQTDYDGTTEVFTVISVLYTNGKANFSIYPNPLIGNSFHLTAEGKAKGEEVQLNVMNLQGKLMEKIMLRSDQFGIIDKDIQLSSKLQKGNYIFELVSSAGESYLKVVGK